MNIIINYTIIFYVSLKTFKFSYLYEFPIIRQFNIYEEILAILEMQHTFQHFMHKYIQTKCSTCIIFMEKCLLNGRFILLRILSTGIQQQQTSKIRQYNSILKCSDNCTLYLGLLSFWTLRSV
jgi:hypothetical protein